MEIERFFIGEYQTVTDVMKARDERAYIQRTLQSTFDRPLVSFKMNIPGPVKYNDDIHRMFDEGLKAFREQMKAVGYAIAFEKLIYENSGPEYFAVFDASPQAVKYLTSSIENHHGLGRIFDFDVLQLSGDQLSREDIGMGRRKCLVCEQEAFICSRERNHGLQALLEKIHAMYRAYFQID